MARPPPSSILDPLLPPSFLLPLSQDTASTPLASFSRHTMNVSDNSTPASWSPQRQSRYSCLSCRQLKRRCSRQLPSCALCARVGRLCEYDGHAATAGPAGQLSPTPIEITNASAQFADGLSAAEPSIPSLNTDDDSVALAAVFLDSIQSRGAKIALPSNLEWHDVCNTLRAASSHEAGAVVEAFHASTHTWFPISEYGRP